MLKNISRYFFYRPDEIGLDNYLVLIFCFISSLVGIFGALINIILGLGWVSIISTLIPALIFTLIYFYSRRTMNYTTSKYLMIGAALVLCDFQWFINFGSTGPVLYLFVVIESFIVIFFTGVRRIVFTSIVLINITALFLVEFRFPHAIGQYENNTVRLTDIYSGLLIYIFITILLLNIALKFYIKQREKAELADKLKSAFLANMSHEIRTPMNGILGFAEILKEPDLSGEQQQECISIIQKSGARMLSIINDIIDISKIESGLMKVELTTFCLNEQIDYIYSFFKPETDKKGLIFSAKTSLPHDKAIINCDSEKLYAIIINLVKNAIKYTHEGSIEFGYILSAEQPDMLEFYVKDTGIGIAKDRQEAIFERFIQADINDRQAYQGAGLGLSIAKAYIEMLKGSIRVESEPGKGTIFIFQIPYIAQPPVEILNDVISSPEITSDLNRLKILIVEDDEASEILITRDVNLFSKEILKARTGPDAIRTCMNNPDIDLILMDIQLPGMDGYEATAEIRKFNKNVVIIAQTAYALTGDRDKALLAGCNDYISKPINKTDLHNIITQYFEMSSSISRQA